MIERKREGLVGEELDQAFQEGIKWLEGLPTGEFAVRNSDLVVHLSYEKTVENMGLGDKVIEARGFLVHLESPGTEEVYEISDYSGLRRVTSWGGNLFVPTTILGELPLHGVSKCLDGKNWEWEGVDEERYKLVHLTPSRGQELTPEEIESGKLGALKVIYWLKTDLT